MLTQRSRTGPRLLHYGKDEDAAPTTYGDHEGGWDICGPTEGSAKTSREGQTQNVWISEETWRLVDERVSVQRGTGVQMRIRRLGRAIRESLQGDRKRRVETVGQDVETLLGGDPPKPKEVWRRLKGWYKDAVNRVPPPA